VRVRVGVLFKFRFRSIGVMLYTFLSWVMVRLRGFEKFNLLLTADDLMALKEAEEEYRRGETISHEELVKKLLEEN